MSSNARVVYSSYKRNGLWVFSGTCSGVFATGGMEKNSIYGQFANPHLCVRVIGIQLRKFLC